MSIAAPVSLNESYEGVVESLAFGGDGIIRHHNFVVFVPFGIPGDSIRFKITELKPSFARADISEIAVPSPHRVTPQCSIYHECGGCKLQEIDYETSMKEKSSILKGLLTHHLGESDFEMSPPLLSPLSYGYRNKMQLAVGANMSGKTVLGLYRPKSHFITDMSTCPIQEETNNRILSAFRKSLERFKWAPYNEKNHSGIIRHFLSRTNQKGEAYITVVTTTKELSEWKAFKEFLLQEIPTLQGISLNTNREKTNVVLGSKTRILWGKDYLEEYISNYTFRMGPTSFFQVNSGILKQVIEQVLYWAHITDGDSILDLYCGIGAFTIPFGMHCKNVLGVEENRESIRWGRENAQINGVPWVEFLEGATEAILPSIQGRKFSLVFVDPPRRGLSNQVLDWIIQQKPSRLLYLSCNPPTLMRDLGTFLQRGWKLKKVMAIDFFPQTAQIEALSLLENC